MQILTPESQQEIKSQLALLAILIALFVIFSFFASFLHAKPPATISSIPTPQAGTGEIASGDYKSRIAYVSGEVNPTGGIQTKIILGDVVPKMVAFGIIDIEKVKALYKNGAIPEEEMKMLTEPTNTPLAIDANNVPWIVDILWPLGLSNKMEINKQSPVAGQGDNLASTGGWSLGKATTGGEYFNNYALVPLTPAQEQRVLLIAKNTYRPCCDNPSFFQDCNHGSAAMAIIELGVSQNLSDADIYKTLLAFNSFWFPQNYIETALYFNLIKGVDWKDVDPKIILGKDYSSLSGWTKNVDTPVQKISGLIPQTQSGASCGT